MTNPEIYAAWSIPEQYDSPSLTVVAYNDVSFMTIKAYEGNWRAVGDTTVVMDTIALQSDMGYRTGVELHGLSEYTPSAKLAGVAGAAILLACIEACRPKARDIMTICSQSQPNNSLFIRQSSVLGFTSQGAPSEVAASVEVVRTMIQAKYPNVAAAREIPQ